METMIVVLARRNHTRIILSMVVRIQDNLTRCRNHPVHLAYVYILIKRENTNPLE